MRTLMIGLLLINFSMFDFYYKTISLEANRVMDQTDIERGALRSAKEVMKWIRMKAQ